MAGAGRLAPGSCTTSGHAIRTAGDAVPGKPRREAERTRSERPGTCFLRGATRPRAARPTRYGERGVRSAGDRRGRRVEPLAGDGRTRDVAGGGAPGGA